MLVLVVCKCSSLVRRGGRGSEISLTIPLPQKKNEADDEGLNYCRDSITHKRRQYCGWRCKCRLWWESDKWRSLRKYVPSKKHFLILLVRSCRVVPLLWDLNLATCCQHIPQFRQSCLGRRSEVWENKVVRGFLSDRGNPKYLSQINQFITRENRILMPMSVQIVMRLCEARVYHYKRSISHILWRTNRLYIVKDLWNEERGEHQGNKEWAWSMSLVRHLALNWP